MRMTTSGLPRSPVLFTAAAVCWTLSACGPDASVERGEVEARDSAGVRVVTLRGDVRGYATPRLGLEEEYRLGTETGTELYRVTDAAFLSSGELVVANSGAPEVLVFAEGELAARFGSAGEGPGEFGMISSVHAPGDGTIVTYDHSNGRLTEFGPSGEVRGTRRMTDPSRVADLEPLTLSEEGVALAVYTDIRQFRQGGVHRDTTPLFRFRPERTVPDTLARWGTRVWSFGSTGTGTTRAEVPYGPTLLHSGGSGGIALADSHETEVRVSDGDGRTHLVVRWETVPEPVTADDMDRWSEERWGDYPENMPEEVRRNLTEVEPSDTHPVSHGVHLGDGGGVWIAPTDLRERTRQGWLVLDEGGEPRGSVRLPHDAEILASRDGRVAVLERDDLDVETVVVYRLDPSG